MMLWVPSLASLSGLGSGVALSFGVGRRRNLDLALLWLWHRPAATDLIGSLAWEPPCVVGVALEKTKKKKDLTMGISTLASLSLDLPLAWMSFSLLLTF